MKVSQEHVQHPDHSFRFLRFTVDGAAGQWHRHRQIELTWIERGSGIRFVGDNASPFGDRDLVLLGPNVPHLWLGAALPSGEQLSASVIQFPVDLLAAPLLPELAPIRAVIDRAGGGLHVQGACHAGVTAAMTRMRDAAPLARLGALMEVFAALALPGAELTPVASRQTHAESGAAGAAGERRVQRVIEWIHSNLAQPLPVARAAAVAHVTPEAFSRFFRRETGKTYTGYLGDVRCSAACLRLRQTDHPVARIAQDCGYGTTAHFNRQFLRRTGVTPRVYRRS